METLYQVYGIPDDLDLDVSNINKYDYVIFYPIMDGEIILDGIGSAELDSKDYLLWGAVEYWTELEASLLLAGLNPNNQNLYAVGEVVTWGNDGLPITTYYWINENLFLVAKEFLFLFGRSPLTPKAAPIEWIRYYEENFHSKLTLYNHLIFSGYSNKWLNYFNFELSKNNQVEKVIKQESTRKTENLLRALTAIAIDAYGYSPVNAKSNVPQDIVNALSNHGVIFDQKTVRNWLKEGVSLLASNSDKE